MFPSSDGASQTQLARSGEWIIDRIKSGEFASESIADQQSGHRRLRELADAADRNDLVPVETTVRALMKRDSY